MPMRPKVVILGSTGFVGAALLQHLREKGGLKVEGYHSSTLDLTSPDCADRLCEVVDAQTILIVAARSRRRGDSFEAFGEDIAIATNVARLLSRRRLKKCLYFSTLSVYGDGATNLSITEETPIAPTSLYGIAKFAGECVVRQAAQKSSIATTILRPCKVYGPGDSSGEYGPAGFIESILRERRVRLFGDGTELRDHLFVRDLVQMTLHFALGDQCGTFNLATGRSHSFQEIITCLRRVTQEEFEVIHGKRDRPKIDQRINPAKLLRALPGFRFTELEQGLKETYRYLSRNLSAGA